MQPPQELNKVLIRFRKALASHGLNTNTGINRAFTRMDGWDKNKTLDRQELYDGLRALGVQVSKDELHLLFDFMDRDKNNKLSLSEFFRGVRGELTPQRLAIITEVFKNLDKNHNQVLEMNDMIGYYSAFSHPDVKDGSKSEKQIFEEFLDHTGGVDGDERTTWAEWLDYYSGLSARFENEVEFIDLVRHSWKL